MAQPLKLKIGRSTLDVPWSGVDRAIQAAFPEWGTRRLQARVTHAMVSELGGYNGASKSRRSLMGWNPLASDADSDTLPALEDLRPRSRDLVRNSPVAGAAVNTTVTKVIGTGLALLSAVDAEYLNLSDEAADAWQQDVERKFNAWWESTDCDITRTQNGYGLQDLLLRAECESGDVFAVLTKAPWARSPVKLAVQVIEADRCCNRDRAPDGPNLVAGVSTDVGGAPLRYHFCSANPYRRSGSAARRPLTWTSVDAFGSRTGRRNVLHMFHRRRPGQTRGVPMLAPVIEPLKQLERYTEAELMAAVVSGLFTVFIKTENGQSSWAPSALQGQGGATAPDSAGGWNGKLGNGLVVELGQREDISTANPGRPNAQFDPFVTAILKQVGMVLEIPYEVLVKHYSSSYTAARGALLDAWQAFRVRRERVAQQICQPIYEAWMDEAVASGYVSAPGYFADPLTRMAWLGALWIGDGPGVIDPVKEVDAAERRVSLKISTREAESLLHDGGKLRRKLRQLAREQALIRDTFKLDMPTQGPSEPVPAPGARRYPSDEPVPA